MVALAVSPDTDIASSRCPGPERTGSSVRSDQTRTRTRAPDSTARSPAGRVRTGRSAGTARADLRGRGRRTGGRKGRRLLGHVPARRAQGRGTPDRVRGPGRADLYLGAVRQCEPRSPISGRWARWSSCFEAPGPLSQLNVGWINPGNGNGRSSITSASPAARSSSTPEVASRDPGRSRS